MTFEEAKCKLQYLIPHHLLSRSIARLAESKIPFIRDRLIKLFIATYKVDLNIAAIQKLSDYECFNQFFTRALLKGVRPIVSGENELASPADGIVSQAGVIKDGKLFQAKGHDYSLIDLLGGHQEYKDIFDGGSFITIYLAPKDYHRVHIPIDGKLLKTIYVPGRLFSVNRSSVAHLPRLFCKNERLISLFETKIGQMAVIMVGAMLVAGIETVWGQKETPYREKKIVVKDYQTQNIHLNKGSEMGRFKFGSTVILLFPAQKVVLTKFQSGATIIMGSLMGQIWEGK